jgi:hypothetical protein
MSLASVSVQPDEILIENEPERVQAIILMTAYLAGEAKYIGEIGCRSLFIKALGILCDRANMDDPSRLALLD